MTTLFLFGAGASYGSGHCHPKRPPLGVHLYQDLKRFSRAIQKLPPTLDSLFRNEHFESAMHHLKENYPEHMNLFLRDMSVYFSMFTLYDSQSRFANALLPPKDRMTFVNYYQSVMKMVLMSKKKVVFSTTNYDMLIEEAIESLGKDVSYSQERDSKYQTIYKIHGSCNFVASIGKNFFRNLTFVPPPKGQVIDIGGGNSMISVESFKAVTRNTVRFELTGLNNSLSAAIAMYEPTKEVIHGSSVVKKQFDRWKNAVNEADEIVIIGLRLYKNEKNEWADGHIWDTLAQSSAKIFHVGFEFNDFERWASDKNKRNYASLGRTFLGSLHEIKELLCPDVSFLALDNIQCVDPNYPVQGSSIPYRKPFRTYNL